MLQMFGYQYYVPDGTFHSRQAGNMEFGPVRGPDIGRTGFNRDGSSTVRHDILNIARVKVRSMFMNVKILGSGTV